VGLAGRRVGRHGRRGLGWRTRRGRATLAAPGRAAAVRVAAGAGSGRRRRAVVRRRVGVRGEK
jgi:hypothetical protein